MIDWNLAFFFFFKKFPQALSLWCVCLQTEPWSSSGAIRLAANFSTPPIRFADCSTTSFTNFTGSEPILARPPGGHASVRAPLTFYSFSECLIQCSVETYNKCEIWVELEETSDEVKKSGGRSRKPPPSSLTSATGRWHFLITLFYQ